MKAKNVYFFSVVDEGVMYFPNTTKHKNVKFFFKIIVAKANLYLSVS